MPTPAAAAPRVAHVVCRFDYGGVGNGIVNLVNRKPAHRYPHAMVALEGIGAEFARRMRCTLRRLRPAIVHTRDLRLRRLPGPLPQACVAMSHDIARWREQGVGVPPGRIRQLNSGVDDGRFRPEGPRPAVLPRRGAERAAHGAPVVPGTVDRLDPFRNQVGLLRAFHAILDRHPEWQPRLRMIIAGGRRRGEQAAMVREIGLAGSVWFLGARGDAPDLTRAMDVFVRAVQVALESSVAQASLRESHERVAD